MIPIEIEEPNIDEILKSSNIEFSIGIDFGTTNSVCFLANTKEVIPVKFETGFILPSIVSIDKNLNYTFGNAVEGNVNIKSFKRLIDSNLHNSRSDYKIIQKNNETFIEVFHQEIPLFEIVKNYISHIKNHAQNQSVSKITTCVITVPAYFNETQRNFIKLACEKASLNVLRIINEPTASMIAYHLENEADGKFAVYDLGGGTFDVSILKASKGVLRVVSTKGDVNLGGDDFDQLIIEQIKTNFHECINCKNFRNSIACGSFEKLKELSKDIKHHLNTADFCQKITLKHKSINFNLSQEKWSEISQKLVERTLVIFFEALQDAKLKLKDLNGIILVGGSTRMKIIKDKLSTLDIKIFDNVDPDLIVAQGAAIKSKELTFGSGNVLIDINPLSVGIETLGGKFEPIIQKNTPLPAISSEIFSTSIDNQGTILINVYQGDRPFVSDCKLIGAFKIKNIPPMKAREPQVKITFQIDTDGLLTVSSLEKKTGIAQSVEIKPMFGMSVEDVTKLREDALQHREEDLRQLNIVNSHDKARELIYYIEKALNQSPEIFKTHKTYILKEIKKFKNGIDSNQDLSQACIDFETFLAPLFDEITKQTLVKLSIKK